ncbi:endonuclease G [Actinokineospora baliensis]|uniref:DNA/RNA non-specific endonuclease n=1 Tax=Actinokineospora baliensis TaxID=547056 RepID=UPI001958A971|nr:DNA/RNA non-specific endonuclease [Actinokineospora baliensis]MBM7773580.1 endonuclease G [Actinokineospora baliensis]
MAAPGYDPDFLGVPLPVPELGPGPEADAVRLDGSTRVDYTHFSLALSASRRFAYWVAWNVDGGGLRKLARTGIPFVKDPRLPEAAQVGDEVYQGNRLDRGHLARRADLLWGTEAEAKRANRDSFYFTNITPQVDDFNQSVRAGLWGRLEDALYADVEVDRLRVSVFGGPVLGDDDRAYRGVLLPREFWKVIASVQAGALKASAFVLTQSLNRLESLDFAEFRVYQVPLAELEPRLALGFPPALVAADTAAPVAAGLDERPPLDSADDISWS